MLKLLKLFFVFLIVISANAQTDASIVLDTFQFKLAEEVKIKLIVNSEPNVKIDFPSKNSFRPFEIINQSDIDTVLSDNRLTYIKNYSLIIFDSGTYYIPKQKLLINDKPFYTDSVKVVVNDVVVDTVEQSLYPIKTILTVKKNKHGWWKPLLISFFILSFITILIYFLRKIYLNLSSELNSLPPFESAIKALKNLENKQLNNQDSYKHYYSEITEIVRKYLYNEINIDALESTSNQLLKKLELLNDAGTLKLSKKTISSLKEVLTNADLVKFARALPEKNYALKDRFKIELFLKNTKNALPNFDDDKIKRDNKDLKLIRKRFLIKTLSFSLLIILITLGVGFSSMVYSYGLTETRDLILNNSTLKLKNKEWVSSFYGISQINIKSPDVLTRINTDNKLFQEFIFQDLSDSFFINLKMEHTKSEDDKEIDLNDKINQSIDFLKQNGATNIFQKQNNFSTSQGIEGITASGSFDIKLENDKVERKKYEIYFFTENNGFQQLIFVYELNDIYAPQIKDKIIENIKFKIKPNDKV